MTEPFDTCTVLNKFIRLSANVKVLPQQTDIGNHQTVFYFLFM